MINFDKIYNAIKNHTVDNPKGDYAIFSLVLAECKNNEDLAIAFLRSVKGGFTKTEINQVQAKRRWYFKNKKGHKQKEALQP